MAQSSKKFLRSLADRPVEERRAIASKGGHATAAKKRERKLLREIIQACGERPITVSVMGGGSEKTTYDVAMVLTMYREAIVEGNVRAAEFLAKISGAIDEKPAVSAGLVIPRHHCLHEAAGTAGRSTSRSPSTTNFCDAMRYAVYSPLAAFRKPANYSISVL